MKIKVEDLIQSIENALQFISYYHPKDFIEAMVRAYETEKSKPAKNAIANILINSKMAAHAKRPICQDTGIICAFVQLGIEVTFDCTDKSVNDMINEGVRRAYSTKSNPLRPSIVYPPHGGRKNTTDNAPAIIHLESVKGSEIKIQLSAKGGGSEFKSKFQVLNPSDDIIEWVIEKVKEMGAGWCPPGIMGIGIGGTAEKAMMLAKESLNEEINMHSIIKYGPQNEIEKLRMEIYEKINMLGIGAQGLGGLNTVLDVKIKEYPTHAACKPIALIPNCAATRHIEFTLDGSGVAKLETPNLKDWPTIEIDKSQIIKHININTCQSEQISTLKAGDNVMISGTLLTARDAAHKRIVDLIKSGKKLPVTLKNKFIYYVGPVAPTENEIVGPAGPTTATRMDKFTDVMLRVVQIAGMIGKAERSLETVQLIKKHKSIYFIAVGGAAYLISKSIKKAKIVAFHDLGMEAIHEFEVENMPVTVAVDSSGTSIHHKAPEEWRIHICNSVNT